MLPTFFLWFYWGLVLTSDVDNELNNQLDPLTRSSRIQLSIAGGENQFVSTSSNLRHLKDQCKLKKESEDVKNYKKKRTVYRGRKRRPFYTRPNVLPKKRIDNKSNRTIPQEKASNLQGINPSREEADEKKLGSSNSDPKHLQKFSEEENSQSDEEVVPEKEDSRQDFSFEEKSWFPKNALTALSKFMGLVGDASKSSSQSSLDIID